MPNSSAAKRIEQGAYRWAKENQPSKNHKQRTRFAADQRRAFLQLPLELRESIDMAIHTAELRREAASA